MIKEVKIGEVVQYNSIKLKCKETSSADCISCFFNENNIDCTNKQISHIIGFCSIPYRKDNKNVIFVKIN